MKFLSCVTKCIFEHLASNILTLFGVLNYIKSIKLFLNEAFKSKIGLKLNNTENQSWRHKLFYICEKKKIFLEMSRPLLSWRLFQILILFEYIGHSSKSATLSEDKDLKKVWQHILDDINNVSFILSRFNYSSTGPLDVAWVFFDFPSS